MVLNQWNYWNLPDCGYILQYKIYLMKMEMGKVILCQLPVVEWENHWEELERIGKRSIHHCQKVMPLFLGGMTKDIREPFTDRQTSKRQERVVGIFMELEQKGRTEDTTDWTKILDTLKQDSCINLTTTGNMRIKSDNRTWTFPTLITIILQYTTSHLRGRLVFFPNNNNRI